MKESAKEVLLKIFLDIKDKEIKNLKGEISTNDKQIIALQKQCDELLSAFQKFIDSHEECLDFDGFTVQIVSMDDYHEAQEIIDIARKEVK